jgi:acyl transferase domain-containing protein
MVLGVIKSTFINHGGRTGGYTVPNPNAQAELIGAALERAGIHPESIGYVEVASNGSALGDPVEIAGLCKAFQRYTDKTGFCAIGAVKSNLGHPEAASGMAQLSKTLLQLQSGTLFPSLHAEPLNPNLRLENTPFYVQKTLAEWAMPPLAPFARRAAISSFGAGGSNAHLIVEEFLASATDAAPTSAPQIIVLSAKTAERLAERVRDLLAFLRVGSHQGLANLADIAYTLQTGREAMKARLAFIASNHSELLHHLERYCEQATLAEVHLGNITNVNNVNTNDENLYQNTLDRSSSPLPLLLDGEEGRTYLATVLASRKYEKIAQLWTIGADIDWEVMHASANAAQMPHRCHLPGYPFARIRHWVAQASTAPRPSAAQGRTTAQNRTTTQERGAREPVPPAVSIPTPPARPLIGQAGGKTGEKTGEKTGGQAGIQTAIRQHLKEFIAEILLVAIDEIDIDIDMREYGFDSINLAELATRTNACFGLDLSVDLFFGHSSIEKCARFLWHEYSAEIEQWHTHISGAALAPPEPEPVSALRPMLAEPVAKPAASGMPIWLPSGGKVANHGPVAIIGMNGFMPQSDNLGQFWQHLISGRELIEDMSEVRKRKMGMSSESMDQGIEMPSMRGSFLNRVDAFDSLFFGISPREAALMDPQQRLLLEVMWKTIEDAGYPASELAGSDIGVFVGVSNHDYIKLYQRMRGEAFAHASTGMMVQSILANRVSYLFDLHGPSEIVDAACSSSTVALDRAVRAIRNGECDSALVGGVNVLLDWHGYAVLHKAGILSKNGRVRMFSRDGTGYVRGEGVGAVWLKPLDRAIADRDHVYAVIRGSATSFDGKTYSMTAPNPLAQTQAVRKAFEQAGVNPTDVCHIEAQGTGSAFGDPVEVNAFKGAFRSLYQQWGITGESAAHCGIGYLKPQIGHLESASGMAGLFKILLSMQHNVLPGTCNLEDKDMSVNLTGSPFFVDSANRAWEPRQTGPGKPAARCASLHSFGIGGVNAHVVMEEYLGEE